MQVPVKLSPEDLEYIVTSVAEKLRGRGSEQYLNVENAAKLIDGTPGRVYDLVMRGAIPKIRDGRRLLVRRSDVVQYLESGR
jgi:excisionase family DNA binding protein